MKEESEVLSKYRFYKVIKCADTKSLEIETADI